MKIILFEIIVALFSYNMSYCYTSFSCFVVAKTIVLVFFPLQHPHLSVKCCVFLMYVWQNVWQHVQQKQIHGHGVNYKWICSRSPCFNFLYLLMAFCSLLLLELKLWKQYRTYNQLFKKIWSLSLCIWWTLGTVVFLGLY